MKVIRFALGFALCFIVAAFRLAAHRGGLPQFSTNPVAGIFTAATAPMAKMNAYTQFNNRIVEWQHFDQEIQDVRQRNSGILNSHGPITRVYTPSPRITVDQVNELKKAIAMPESIPEVDAEANSMLAAISTLQPTEESLASYNSSREYLSDGGARARQQIPRLVEQLAVTGRAEGAFGRAISQWKLKQDELTLGTLDKGSLHYATLNDSLVARRLLECVSQFKGRQEAQHLDQVIPQLVAANKAVDQPEGNPYKEQIDKVIGNARLLSAALKRDPHSFRVDPDLLDSRLMVANMSGNADNDAPPLVVEAALIASYNESVNRSNSLRY